MTAVVSTRCIVSGRVQGVFFRASTRRKALELGVCGHAINRSDGGVEVVASGPADAVAALRAWLHEGPPDARVDGVACEACEPPDHDGFFTG